MNIARSDRPSISVVLPARNEAAGLAPLLAAVRLCVPDAEILVIDDGSRDDTAQSAERNGAAVEHHPYPKGNGASIKTGSRAARGDVLVFMDADGQHDPADIPRLLAKLQEGYDMVVGARNSDSQAGWHRRIANTAYNKLASWVVGHRILDLTSGMRAARADKFKEFLYLLPNGFSYPTTITMAFFRAGYSVGYVPIDAGARNGKSHIRLVMDGAKFLLIIFRVGTLYSPLKVFLPVSLAFFGTGLGHYAYTYTALGRFTNMSALLFIFAVVVFLIGLVSEQITALMYRRD